MAQKTAKSIIAQPIKGNEGKVQQMTPAPQFVFAKANYQIFLLAIAIVIIGFALMTGTTDIYDFRKIVLAPLTVLTGFGIGFFAIFKKTNTKA